MPPEAFATIDALITRLEAWSHQPSVEVAGLTELDHGLQCAETLAQEVPGDDALAIAGLVHDIGHHITSAASHAEDGAALLEGLLGPRVAAIVGLHVAAKRYLVTTDPAYRALLSPGSVETLRLQGGDMSPGEVADFEARPWWQDAVRLRRADEAAKQVGRQTRSLSDWLPALRQLAA
ncbi:MAG: HD domain-containing protein [Sphingomonadales bacterium]|jgi:predicted HD phosphohydrolase